MYIFLGLESIILLELGILSSWKQKIGLTCNIRLLDNE